jgi:L-rhamnose-H+ transport protein
VGHIGVTRLDVAIGLMWIVSAGVMQGLFAAPMKYARRWQFEHLWFWYSITAFFVLPLLAALATVPHLLQSYGIAPASVVVLAMLFGLAWGIGSVCFGLGLDAWGFSLGFPLMTGLYTALGALVPMAVLTPELLLERRGRFVLAGNFATVVAVILFARAGHLRDRARGRPPAAIMGAPRTFSTALALCLTAGVLSSMFNFGYAFGTDIAAAAQRVGATPEGALNALWLLMLPAGGLVNLGYCVWLMRQQRSSVALVQGTIRDWTNAALMSVLWTGSVFVYGWGAARLGALGPTLGWSLWNAVMIASTVVWGIGCGEWQGVAGRPRYLLYGAANVLGVGMVILGFAT